MHLDYNYHSLNENWWREMNLLLSLNKEWKQEYGGHLKKIRDLRTDESAELAVDFNTLIIQKCGVYTLHRYNPTNFPEGNYRTSIATHFTEHFRQLAVPRTTDCFPEKDGDGVIKKWMGRNFHKLVKLKNTVLGTGTAKNI